MQPVPLEHLQRTISILGDGDRRDTEVDIAVGRFAADRMTVRRLVDWIPEAFGFVLLPYVADVVLPTTFSVKAADGRWKHFVFEREPLFADAVQLGAAMYREDPRGMFSHIARRSSVISAVNESLDTGASLTGAKVSGPALLGVPAEFYEEPKAKAGSFWRKLVG